MKYAITNEENRRFLGVDTKGDFCWHNQSNNALLFDSEEQANKFEENEARNFLQFETDVRPYLNPVLSNSESIEVLQLALARIKNGDNLFMCPAIEKALESLYPIKHNEDDYDYEVMKSHFPDFMSYKPIKMYNSLTDRWFSRYDRKSRIDIIKSMISTREQK